MEALVFDWVCIRGRYWRFGHADEGEVSVVYEYERWILCFRKHNRVDRIHLVV